MIHAGMKPLLAPHARMEIHADRFSVDGGEVSVDYDGDGARYASEMVSSLDGRMSVTNIADRHGIDTAQVVALLRPLYEESLLLDAAVEAHEGLSGRVFQEAFRHECRFWNRHIFAQKFWRDLSSGTASLSTVLGWGVEF